MMMLTPFKNFSVATNHGWFSGGLIVLRLVIGIDLFLKGIDKISGWSAASFLESSTGPMAAFFQGMAGSVLIDQLNIWGMTLIGLALILGLMVRPAAFFGVIMMLLYYFAHFVQNTEYGYIDIHIIYILVFILFLAGGIGHIFGLDGTIYRHFRKKKMLGKLFFG
ncbi:MAG: DoxX family membrane protein [Patescibacteria group bacterium]